MTKLVLILSAMLYLAMVILALRPAFDLDIAGAFYVGPDHFVGDTRAGVVVRYTAWALPFAIFGAMTGAAVLARAGRVAPRFAPSGRSLAMLTLSLAIGPGLLVHAGLKELSHRPRPYAVTQFGGHDLFRPFWRFDGACRHNCAFPSGETAAATWTLAPASLVPPPWRGAALALALVFAAGTAALRMAFGAHFASDTLGAMLIVMVVILACRAITGLRRGPTSEEGDVRSGRRARHPGDTTRSETG